MSFKYSYGWSTSFTSGTLADVREMQLSSPKRGFAAFQAGIWSDTPFAATRTENPYLYKGGPLPIARAHVEFAGWPGAVVQTHWVGFVCDDDGLRKSDILLSQETIEVEARATQYLWVELPVPASAPAGEYTGRVVFYAHTMFETEVEVGAVSFSLRVYDVLLPEPKDYRFYLDLWQHAANIARKYEVELWSDAHFAVLESYVASLADLGQKAITVIASEAPWSGQASHKDRDYLSDLFEYSMIRVRREMDGAFAYDFSSLDRYIEMSMRLGITSEIEVFGLIGIWQYPEAGYSEVSDFGDDVRVRYFDAAAGVYAYMHESADIAVYIKALEQHFIGKGWIDIVRVVADEPSDIELYQQRLNKLRSIAPNFRFKTAINHVEMIEQHLENMYDYVPALKTIWRNWDDLLRLRQEVPGRLCWYICCNPAFPNTFISSPLVESQLIPVLTKHMGLDGFLRWNYTVWPEDPRRRISYRAPFWPAGDTNFVYPGGVGPLLSLRYKNLQRGIQTFELLCMAEAATNGAELVEEYMGRVLRTRDIGEYAPEKRNKPTDLYSLDGAAYAAAWDALLSGLAQAEKGD